MSDVTIKQLAKVLGTTPDTLLGQLAEAGMEFSDPDQAISSADKVRLLTFLRGNRGLGAKAQAEGGDSASPRQITLRRRRVSELTVNPGQRGAAPKTVNVEVRQKRTYVKRSAVEAEIDPEREEAIRKLSEAQQQRADEEKRRLELERRREEEEARARAEEEDRRRAEEDAARRAAEEAEQARIVAEAAAAAEAAEAEAAAAAAAAEAAAAAAAPPPAPPAERERARPAAPERPGRRARGRDGGGGRFAGELHLSREGAARRSSGRKRARVRPSGQARSGAHGFSRPTAPVVREVAVGESITVSDLAQALAIKGADVVKELFKMGVMATINQSIDHDTAVLVAEELGHRVIEAEDTSAEGALLARQAEVEGEQVPRPPVVTIMGHVDHGKTSLLDYIRRTRIASGEAGGITQHIGAYHVETPKGVITFLDTPGHSAFSSMRARGTQVTDIVVLVVAADDGVMPQTVEAIQHARAAEVPLIVAINKMDKADANPDAIKQALTGHEVVPEDWGGDVQFVPLSAKTGMGIDDLLDAISVQAEIMDLTAVAEGHATGSVIESSLDRGRGPVATVLVQQGQLNRGDYLVCGVEFGRVRAMFDETGSQVQAAGPSIPVQVLGLSGVPEAGDDFVVVDDERLAREVAEQRQHKLRESRLVRQASNRMESIMAQMGEGQEQQVLNLVIKADVQGSAEALNEALTAISTDDIRVNVIASGVGGITESDATLAAASKAVIIGFNVRADAAARRVIESNGLDLRYFSIIYDVIDQVTQVATGLLGTEIREDIIGTAEVREVFRSSKFGAVAGCMVLEGTVRRNKPIRVLRDNTVIFQGELESLRRFKEDVDEVRSGTECGIGVRQYNDIKPGDQIECFERVEVARTL